jgi:cholesterol oxidase
MGQFDAIVIGSGFGGAVMACRAAERGMKVLVLERGRRWAPGDYPRKPGDPWLFNTRQPHKQNGWLDLQFFKHMIVAQAAGVGGGSLSYSSVALEAHPSVFASGWPAAITYDELKPHYDTVARMLRLQTLPDGQLTQRFKLAREAAEKLGDADRFAKAPLAVSFSPDWNYQLPDPFNARHSVPFTNPQGRRQGTCIHLGNCDIGCDVQAKNTLDLTYLAAAEALGADVRPLHLVRVIQPEDGGYKVRFDRIHDGELVRGDETATHVFVAAGSLGSTELLLRCRDEHHTLPKLSPALGRRWSANANVLTMATYPDGDRVQQSVGPTISSVFDFLDGTSASGQRFVVEDDGFPSLLRNALLAWLESDPASEIAQAFLRRVDERGSGKETTRNLMVWLGAGMDGAAGQLSLDRPLLAPRSRRLALDWKPDHSAGVVEAILEMHRSMVQVTGGRIGPDAVWDRLRSLLTLHPLGGCAMGDSADTAVVDHRGEVFGYPNLHVVDGAVVPTAIGGNPSHTIAALAERMAAHLG